ncbi:hypothetical protein O7A70_28725 [Mesorhizobium sp. Cs1299R1N1]|uniref:hypothetical protein n=1 Tax=Mesorhizobium sp. Cs1299R1N1 TaxID=3015172 RepID=UPI00301E439C
MADHAQPPAPDQEHALCRLALAEQELPWRKDAISTLAEQGREVEPGKFSAHWRALE